MIKINLLPYDQRPVTRTPVPHIISLVLLLAVLLFVGQTYLKLNAELSDVSQRIAKQQAAKAQLDATVKEFAELEKQKKQLQTIVATIQVILKDQTIWSEHLHQLAVLTPSNIWYKQLRLTERRFSEEVPAVDAKGNPVLDKQTNKQKMERKQKTRPILEVSGYAIDDESGLSSTSTLANNTSLDPVFSETFQLFTTKIIDTEFDNYQVREFVFEYVVS